MSIENTNGQAKEPAPEEQKTSDMPAGELISSMSESLAASAEGMDLEPLVAPKLEHGDKAMDPKYGMDDVLQTPVTRYKRLYDEVQRLNACGLNNAPETRLISDELTESFDKMSDMEKEVIRQWIEQPHRLCEACMIDDWTDCETPEECHQALEVRARAAGAEEERERIRTVVAALNSPIARTDILKIINAGAPSQKLSTEQLAIQAYYAYGAVTDYKNFRGDPMPEWEDLPQNIRDAWKHSAAWVHRIIRAEEAVSRVNAHS